MKHLRLLVLFLALLLFCGTFNNANAQVKNGEEPLIEQVRGLFPSDYFNLGIIIQTEAEVHWNPDRPGQNTFRTPVVFPRFYGSLNDNFSYLLQFSATSSPAIVDAFISYKKGPLQLRAGAMRPEISEESITPISLTDFINRSRIVNTLVHRRDLGVTAFWNFTSSLSLNVGMYNGPNIDRPNNNNSFFYTGRLNYSRSFNEDVSIRGSLTAAYGEENGTLMANGFFPRIYGSRTIYGGDARINYKNGFINSELFYGDLEYGPQGPQPTDDVFGYQISGGYNVTPATELLLRLDHLESDAVQIAQPNRVIGGVDYHVSSITSLRLNYQINPEDFAPSNQYFFAMVQLWY